MSEDELRQLSPDEVVVQVRRLEVALAAALARIAELEAELARRSGPPKARPPGTQSGAGGAG